MRLIDADNYYKQLDKMYVDAEKAGIGMEGYYIDGIVDAQLALEEEPTIDAVQVVRCKDCKYFSPDEKREKWGKCKIWKAEVLKDGYCSQGEKNEKN